TVHLGHGPADTALSPDGGTLAVCREEDGRLALWDTATGRERLHLGSVMGVPCVLAFSPDGALLAAGGEDEVRLYRTVDGILAGPLHVPEGVVRVAFSPDGKRLATINLVERPPICLTLWDVAGARPLHRLPVARRVGAGLAFSRDGKEVVTLTLGR